MLFVVDDDVVVVIVVVDVVVVVVFSPCLYSLWIFMKKFQDFISYTSKDYYHSGCENLLSTKNTSS